MGGIARPQALEKITEKDWDEIIDANLKSVFLVTQAVLPGMRAAKWGRIINLSSVAAQLGGIIGPHYTDSKAGVLGLTHAYSSLLAGEGITVNAIAPALIETEMIAGNPQARPERIPVGRFGTAEEVAEAVLMLAENGPIAAAASSALALLVLATPTISKVSDSARSAGIWARAAQLLLGCNPTMPTLKRCHAIMFGFFREVGLAVKDAKAPKINMRFN